MQGIAGIRPERALLAAGLLGGVAMGVALLKSFDPATSMIYPPCPFHYLTGLYCPGCGTLRGLSRLLNGEIMAGFGSNPLMVLALPFVLYALAGRLTAWIRGRLYRPVFLPAWMIRSILGLIAAFWVLRNIPIYPFNLLAP